MHTVVETPAYIEAAKDAGMTALDMAAVVNALAADPEAGDMMQGTGGCRKVRFGIGARGKSGGVRVVSFFTGPDLPLFLLTVFAKNEKANLTKNERNQLAALTKLIAERYRVQSARRTK